MRVPVAIAAVVAMRAMVPLDAGRARAADAQSAVELAVQPAPMGDYEVVLNWPRPLPDRDLSHAGWTWGSGAGVFAESPDKVWVAQCSEIQLPPGATPWICPCLLTPRRTNTGRRPYSGKGTTDRLIKYDLSSRYILDIGGHGPQSGQFDGVHQISVDADRNLYVTDVANDRSQKFRPKANATRPSPPWLE